jgi:hypothetical protein
MAVGRRKNKPKRLLVRLPPYNRRHRVAGRRSDMTDLNVKSGSRVPTALAVDGPSFDSSLRSAAGAPPTVARLSKSEGRAAANDDAVASPNAIRNPLWIVVIGMARLFGVMALVTSLG